MKRFFIGKETVTCDYDIELNYYVLANEKESYTEYGIEIEKKDINNVEKSQVTDITTNQTRIDNIVKSLMRNNVTPIHLHDVIIDML